MTARAVSGTLPGGMLDSVTVERYRCFVEPATLHLRPLTLLFGYNSSGKSALLRSLPLVSASCRAAEKSRSGPLALEHPSAMGARYDEIRTHLVDRNDLGLTMSWDDASYTVRQIEMRLRDVSDLGSSRQVIFAFRARDAGGREVLSADFDPDADRVVVETEPQRPALAFEGLRPAPATGLPPALQALFAECEARMHGLASSVDWLGPLRAPPPRRVPTASQPVLTPAGEGTTEILAHEDNALLLRDVSEASKAIFGHRIEVRPEGGEVSLVAAFDDGRPRHVLDVGSGVGQALAPLLLLARVKRGEARGRVIAIEQPEAHLHPAAEAELAKVLVQAVSSGAGSERPRLVIETHSENLLLHVQLAVLQKRLSPDDVIVHWVQRLEDGSGVPRAIRFDTHARPDPPWPPTVFSEDVEIARQILRARRAPA
jgi:hypothetical protein